MGSRGSSWDRKHNFRGEVRLSAKKETATNRQDILNRMLATSAEKKHDQYVNGLSEALQGGSRNSTFGNGYEEIAAPTSGGNRPRALKCGYAKSIGALIIVMRDESWILYEDVDPNYWTALQRAYSTNTYVETFLSGHSWSKISPGSQPKARPEHFKDGQEE